MPLDLSRAVVTKHASQRWRERIGLPDDRLADALRSAERPDKQMHARIRFWLAKGKKSRPWIDVNLAIDSQTGAVFVVKRDGHYSDGSTCWMVVTITSIDIVNDMELLRCITNKPAIGPASALPAMA